MLKDILPEFMTLALQNINISTLQEVRLRVGKPILLLIAGKYHYLSFDGISDNINYAILTRKSNITEILSKCSNNSLYSINDQLINGFITIADGIRVGVSGEAVSTNGSVNTLKNITSLNIRIPHEIKNCSLPVFDLLVNKNKVYSTLIVSAPGMGKTTFLRDLAYQISSKLPCLNTLIVDERCEITGASGGVFAFDYINADVFTNCTKEYGFTNGIRSMRPDVILTDEIDISKDLSIIENALTCGVNVIATIHANSITDLKNKKGFRELIDLKVIDRFVLLGGDGGVGTIQGVYNSNLSCIYV